MNSSVEDTYFRRNLSIRSGDKLLDLATPQVMGIINITPDSFYEKSRINTELEVLSKVEGMLDNGASIIDIGGYSSRPEATDISENEELKRVTPIVSAIQRAFPEALISIDTFRSGVARAAVGNGANLINDISGFSIDPDIVSVAAEAQIPYVLMHMQGTPQTMNGMTNYENILTDIYSFFSHKIAHLKDAGVKDIILDPGFGFGKTIEQNHSILRQLEYFSHLGLPVLAGLSRKSMIYKKLGINPEDALPGTIALNAIALSKGASILRVHDVKEAVDLIKLLS